MTGTFTNYTASRLARHIFGGEAWNPLSMLYFGLLVGQASKSTNGTEPAGGGYARVAIANTVGNFPNAVDGVKTHSVEIRFPRATANWGTVGQVGIYDSPVGGNLLAWIPLSTAVTVNVNMAKVFDPGNIEVGFSQVTTNLSTSFQNEILNHVFGASAMATRPTLYAAYCTGARSITTPGTEPAVGGYARAAIDNTRQKFAEITPGVIENIDAVLWPTVTADQGTASNLAIFDAASGGNFLAFSSLTSPLLLTVNTIPNMAPGGLHCVIA